MLLSKKIKSSAHYTTLLLIILVPLYAYFLKKENEYLEITSFDECVTAGNQVTATYPEQCKIPGKIFTNHRQKIDPVTLTEILAPTNDSLDLTYIISGSPFSVGANSADSKPTDIKYNDYLNEDTLEDTVFIVEKEIKGNTSYYILLAIGLYSGEKTAANGLLLATGKPKAISKNKYGHIEVTFYCSEVSACSQKFLIKNDILEPL